MAISFVASTSNASTSNDSSYTLLKPSGVQSGDFLLALVANQPGSDNNERNVTAPSGWTIEDEAFAYSQYGPCQITVLSKVAGASEPSSWSGGYSGVTTDNEVTLVAAYRGVAQIGSDTDTSIVGNATSYTVGSVSNSSSSNWRVTAGAYTSGSLSYVIESSENRERALDGADQSGTRDVQAGIWDSDGTVSSGSHSRTISRDAIWTSSAGWIGILEADDTGIPGTMAMTLPDLTVSMSGQQGYQGTMSATVPSVPTVSMSGIASPPEGPLSALVLPTMSVSGTHEGSGTLDTDVTPIVNIVGETRRFGIRVVTPEAEARTITPRLGTVD